MSALYRTIDIRQEMEILRILISVVVLFIPVIMTSDDFSRSAAMTGRSLTQEEINQIEKEPITTLGNCRNRSDFDPRGLCFTFYEYLESKCSRLEFLPSYCGAVASYNRTASLYARINSMPTIKQQCIQDPPLPNDTEGIKKCIGYVQFDSRYNTMPPELIIRRIEVQDNDSRTLNVQEYMKSQVNKTNEPNKDTVLVKIDIAVKNPNIGPIHVEDISLNVSQKENQIISDRINSSPQNLCTGSNYIGCISYPIKGLTSYDILREIQVQTGKMDLNDSKYLINATLGYKFDNSEVIQSKSFSINYP